MHLPPPPPPSPHPLLPCVLNLRFQSPFLPPPAISTSPPSLRFQSAISIILPAVPTSPLRFQSANSIPLPLYTLLFPSSPPMRFESGVSINPRPSNPVPPSSPRDLREEGSSGTIGTSHMRSDTRAAITHWHRFANTNWNIIFCGTACAVVLVSGTRMTLTPTTMTTRQ